MNEEKESCLLKKIESQELNAQKFGFYWETLPQILEQIQNECAEVLEAWKSNDEAHLQEELGDLVHAAVSAVVFCKFDPSETLSKSVLKFQKRYDLLVKLAREDGNETLHGKEFEELLAYWKKAKSLLDPK